MPAKTHLIDIDLKTVCLEILRDLFSASRQLMMYPMGHPITNETLKKPIKRLNKVFTFKRSFIVQVYNRRLVAEGLLLDNTVFVEGLIHDFSRHNIQKVDFSSDLIIGDLYLFLNRLLEGKSPDENYFEKFLEKENIKTIKINTSQSKPLFDFDDTLVDSPGTKYEVDDRIQEIINRHQDAIVAYYLGKINSDDDVVKQLGIDLRLFYLDDKFAYQVSSMPDDKALEIFKQVIYSSNWLGEIPDHQIVSNIKTLWNDYAQKSEEIPLLLPVYDIFKSIGASEDILEYVFDKSTFIKLQAIRDADNIIDCLRSNQAREIDFQLIRKTVFKLAKDGYSKQLENLFSELLKSQFSDVLDTRQRGLRLTIETIEVLTDGSFWEIYAGLVKEILKLALMNKTYFEMIELIGWIVEKSAQMSHWEELKISTSTLQTITGKSTDKENSPAARKLQDLAESPILIDVLVDAVLAGRGSTELYEAISIIASKKLAAILVEKIDSPDKAIRARIIKALTRMGNQIGQEIIKKLTGIVAAGESDDQQKWYQLRNLLRVIGQINYIEAIPYFKIMAGWKQSRIKMELISACESMSSSSTCTVLSKLAEDSDRDVRKASIIAMGISGHPDMIKYLRFIFDSAISDRELIVAAMGRIGGTKARDILIELYENPEIYTKLSIATKEEQKIKLAILKSLANIGDDVSRSKIELYSQKTTTKFFKKDILSETASLLLNGHKK